MAKKAKSNANRRGRRRGIFIFEVIILLILIAGIFVYAQVNEKLGKVQNNGVDMADIGVNEGVDERDLEGFQTLALVGLDTRVSEGEDGSQNSDTMIIASIDHERDKVKLVSLYRDTYLNTGNDKYYKANDAYNTGGAEKMLTMMNKNLDLDLCGYVTVDFQAMVEAIDLLGGLDIQMTADEVHHMNNYCVETGRETDTDFEPIEEEDGVHHLNGVQAVSYARIRYTAGNDFRRAARQRLVIFKMVEKAKQSSLGTLNKIMDVVFPLISSSLTKSEMLKLGMAMLTYDIEDQAGFPFDHLEGQEIKDQVGVDCVLPVTLETNVVKLHEFLYPGEEYEPSETVKEYSDYIVDESGYGENSIPDQSEDGALPLESFEPVQARSNAARDSEDEESEGRSQTDEEDSDEEDEE